MLKALKLLLAVAAALGMSSAFAQGSGPSGFSFVSPPGSPNRVTGLVLSSIGDALNAQRAGMVPPGFTFGGGPPVQNFTAFANTEITTPSGTKLPVTAKATATRNAIGKALFRAAVPLYIGYSLGSDLWDIWQDYGYIAKPDGVYKLVPDGYEYNTQELFWQYYPTRQQACQAFANHTAAKFGAGPWSVVSVTTQECTINGNRNPDPQYPAPGTDVSLFGYRLKPGGELPVTEADFLDKLAQESGWPTRAAQALQQAIQYPASRNVLRQELMSPSANPSVEGRPDGFDTPAPTTPYTIGQPQVTERTYTDPATGHSMTERQTATTTGHNVGNGINFTTTTVTTVTNNTTNVTNTTSTTTTSNNYQQPPVTSPDPNTDSDPAPTEKEDLECGLPDTPPCRIDETGTPEADPAKTQEEIDSLFGPIKSCLQNIESCLPSLPNLSWTFALPTGCAPLSFDTMVGPVVSIDMCSYQDMIHDIMSMLWAAAGVFGAVAMVSRFNGSA